MSPTPGCSLMLSVVSMHSKCHIKDNSTASSLWLVLCKEPISICFNIVDVWSIIPCLCDHNNIVVLQLYTDILIPRVYSQFNRYRRAYFPEIVAHNKASTLKQKSHKNNRNIFKKGKHFFVFHWYPFKYIKDMLTLWSSVPYARMLLFSKHHIIAIQSITIALDMR